MNFWYKTSTRSTKQLSSIKLGNSLIEPEAVSKLVCVCVSVYPPVHPVVIGYLAFAGIQIQGPFSWNSNGPGDFGCPHH